jgi:hypothetical protein
MKMMMLLTHTNLLAGVNKTLFQQMPFCSRLCSSGTLINQGLTILCSSKWYSMEQAQTLIK